MTKVRVTETFKDWDEITVREGTRGTLELRGFSERHQQHFWNIISDDGRVVSVTLGRPPVVTVDTPAN